MRNALDLGWHRPHLRGVFTRVLSVFLLLAFFAPAMAQPVPAAVLPSTDGIETATEALEADAAEYARTYALPLGEAVRRLEAQQASVPLTDRLAQDYGDRLAGIVIDQSPDYRIVVEVAGGAVSETAIATAPFGVPVILRTGALATRAAILDAIRQHQAALRAALPVPPGLGLDPRTGMLLVVVQAGALDEGGAEATAARLQAIAGVPIELRTWDSLGSEADANLSIAGGGRVAGIDPLNGRRFVCTSGFVVTDGIRTALSTAAHCPDQLGFIARDGGETPLAMIGAWGALTQDVQIHDAGQPLAPWFYADDAARPRALTTWRNRASTRAGDIVCHRGMRTGYSCAEIAFPDYAPPGDLCAGDCPATWVAVRGPKCKGGDSGGPVFLGTVAFGLVKGSSTEDGTCKLYYYMSTDYLPAGWTLLYDRGAYTVEAPIGAAPLPHPPA